VCEPDCTPLQNELREAYVRLEAKMDTPLTKLYGRVGWIWGTTDAVGEGLGAVVTLLVKSC